MTRPIDTPATGPEPSEDPGGFLIVLLGRYFTPGYVESLIRTWVPVGVGTALTWVLAWLAAHWHWHIVLSSHASTTVGMVSVGVVTAAYYALGRYVEKHWPKAGRLLLSLNMVKAPPVYPKTQEAVAAVEAAPGFPPAGPPNGRM